MGVLALLCISMASHFLWCHDGASYIWQVYREAETLSAGLSHANNGGLYCLNCVNRMIGRLHCQVLKVLLSSFGNGRKV